MKTRELMHCEISSFANRIGKLKAKELRRHLERVAGELGEHDVDTMMESVINAIFSEEGLPFSSSAEMSRVLGVLQQRIPMNAENEDPVMRLMALIIAYIRRGVRQAARDQRLAERHGHHHHCDAPHCEVHDHGHGGH